MINVVIEQEKTKSVIEERNNVSKRINESMPPVCQGDHEWVVFCTAMSKRRLMVQCVECGKMGTVDRPSQQEWAEAYHSSSHPYRWHDDIRVTRRARDRFAVIRATEATQCECAASVEQPEADYERFPVEFTAPLEHMTDLGSVELVEFADYVSRSGLCSRLFPHFVRGFQESTGHRHSDAVNEAADRIEQIDSAGIHCSPGVVAKILRDFASSLPVGSTRVESSEWLSCPDDIVLADPGKPRGEVWLEGTAADGPVPHQDEGHHLIIDGNSVADGEVVRIEDATE